MLIKVSSNLARGCRRGFSTSMPPTQDVTSKTRTNNVMVAGGLLGFVGVIYYYTVNKIKGKDELQMVIDQEMKKTEGK